jgi:curved DNA-binding protein CbpA
MFGDPYKVLGVSPNASQNEIHRAFQQRAARFRPNEREGSDDRTRPAAGEGGHLYVQYAALVSAYDLLSDPKRKAEFDDSLLNRLSFNDDTLLNIEDPKRAAARPPTRIEKTVGVIVAVLVLFIGYAIYLANQPPLSLNSVPARSAPQPANQASSPLGMDTDVSQFNSATRRLNQRLKSTGNIDGDVMAACSAVEDAYKRVDPSRVPEEQARSMKSVALGAQYWRVFLMQMKLHALRDELGNDDGKAVNDVESGRLTLPTIQHSLADYLDKYD